MDGTLDELYFTWLYSQVGDPAIKNPHRTYWRLLGQFYSKEFVWVVAKDDNRIEDGKDLRYEFVDQSGLSDVDPGWIHLGCSMFELLVGLSRRLSFVTDEGEPRDWFWQLIENLGLQGCNDQTKFDPDYVDEALDRVIWRTYHRDGRGGLFPLRFPKEDQRLVELWYQLNAYVQELD